MQVDELLTHYGNRIFGRKWRIVIVYVLRDGPLRFSQIKSHLPSCSVKVLSESLQDLEQNNVIVRKQYNTIPVKVTYELADHVNPYMDMVTRYLTFLNLHIIKNAELYNISTETVEQLQENVRKLSSHKKTS